jgi:hypothetical protein
VVEKAVEKYSCVVVERCRGLLGKMHYFEAAEPDRLACSRTRLLAGCLALALGLGDESKSKNKRGNERGEKGKRPEDEMLLAYFYDYRILFFNSFITICDW